MNIILGASKAISDNRIHFIEELDVEQLKRNLMFQYADRRQDDSWLEKQVEDTVKSRIASRLPWDTCLFTVAIKVTLWPNATALCSYDVIK